MLASLGKTESWWFSGNVGVVRTEWGSLNRPHLKLKGMPLSYTDSVGTACLNHLADRRFILNGTHKQILSIVWILIILSRIIGFLRLALQPANALGEMRPPVLQLWRQNNSGITFFITLSKHLIKFESQTKIRVLVKLGKHFPLSQLAMTNITTNRVKLNITKSLFLVVIDDSTKQRGKLDAVSLKVTVYFFWFYRRLRNCFK